MVVGVLLCKQRLSSDSSGRRRPAGHPWALGSNCRPGTGDGKDGLRGAPQRQTDGLNLLEAFLLMRIGVPELSCNENLMSVCVASRAFGC